MTMQDKKVAYLVAKGGRIIGSGDNREVVVKMTNGLQATVDIHGRVIWQNQTEGSAHDANPQ